MSETLLKPEVSNELADVWVIIPAQNEEQSLPYVLRDLPEVGCVIVVDNGSTDRTPFVAEDCGCDVVSEPTPGYGQACLTGLSEIRKRIATGEQPPDIVVFLDGDYSDHPENLLDLVRPIKSGQFDLVLGSRLLGERESGAMPPQSVFGNVLACTLMKWIWGASYTDLGPFRAIRYSSLRSLNMSDRNYGWTVEMQIKAKTAGLRTLEVPVSYRRRIGVSKISGTINGTVRAGWKILWTIGKYSWGTRLQTSKRNESLVSNSTGRFKNSIGGSD